MKIGLDNPLTGTLAGLGKNELIGCQFAVEQIKAKGGVLWRSVELIAEDSTSGDAGTAVLKARKLHEPNASVVEIHGAGTMQRRHKSAPAAASRASASPIS